MAGGSEVVLEKMALGEVVGKERGGSELIRRRELPLVLETKGMKDDVDIGSYVKIL